MISDKWLNIIGVGLLILGAGVSIASGLVSDRLLDSKISAKISEALTTVNHD